MFGPTNITSILDRDTYHQKLRAISAKLEMFIQKADEVIEEIKELKGCEPETQIPKKVAEVDSITDAIIKKVNDNEYAVKKKMEEIIKEFISSNVKKSYSEPSEFSMERLSKTKSKTSNKALSILSNKINEYCEAGPFVTHLPQFVYGLKYVIRQYQMKLPEFGYYHILYINVVIKITF